MFHNFRNWFQTDNRKYIKLVRDKPVSTIKSNMTSTMVTVIYYCHNGVPRINNNMSRKKHL